MWAIAPHGKYESGRFAEKIGTLSKLLVNYRALLRIGHRPFLVASPCTCGSGTALNARKLED